MNFTVNNNNAVIQRNVLLVMSSILTLACIATAITNTLHYRPENLAVIVAEIVFAFTFANTAFQAYRHHHRPWHKVFVVYSYAFLIVFAYSQFQPGNSVIHWWYSVPIMTFLILGRVHSLIFSVGVFTIGAGIFIHNNVFELAKPWSAGLVNLVFPYIIITAIANVYERMRIENEQELTLLALTDPLTNAFNRKALTTRFTRLKERLQPFNLVLVDIDHFKKINDNYGHDAGDHVLVEVTRIFKEYLSNLQVFRIGGEEFVLLLEGNQQEALMQADEIRSTVDSQLINYQGQILKIQFSAGLVHCRELRSLSDALKLADNHLYLAKASGRNQISSPPTSSGKPTPVLSN